MTTRAYVIHPDLARRDSSRRPKDALEEALALARALPHVDVVGGEVVPLPRPKPGRLFGDGRVDSFAALIAEREIDLVLIDGVVTPVQQRNLEKLWKVKLLDRTGLILEIFADRAATREGVLQVDLAALSYQRTRLVRSWTHLERQRGGLGFVGGPGETQIEADRRAIDDQILRIRKQLGKVVKTRALHRSARAKVPFPIVALVGYTNAGKSTLFNRLTGAEVMAKDMLFATLDPTMRAVELPNGLKVILSDTVGFISDLPTQLVAAFRATLEEVLDADVVLHVRDISHPETEAQSGDVAAILEDLDITADSRPMIEAWNKIDIAAESDVLRERAARQSDVCAISAITGEGLDRLSAMILERVTPPQIRQVVVLAYSDGAARAWLHARADVVMENPNDNGLALTVEWSARDAAEFATRFKALSVQDA